MTNTSSTHQHPRQENKAHTLSPDSSVSGLMQGLEGPVTVCCTNTGKFVGAEAVMYLQQGPPIAENNPTTHRMHRTHRRAIKSS